ncbi:rho GTPase-activating protein 27 isoform X4 [Alosa sapidissima]|uniref:rho GTPase-activating protein 27 isoform X4 n=1 Tax=Alosa sapidissima TaxID=34773 RepID=UPI001C07F745|nr:rho GTPase-activating protein 27 isoform X4 [Alosa sapidissima]
MAASATEFVLVLFPYDYTTKDGRSITIHRDDRYILVNRTNSHWWHVRKDPSTKPFYIPARYVQVLEPITDPLAPLNAPSSGTEGEETAARVGAGARTASDQNQPEGEIGPCWLTPTEEKTELELAPSLREPKGLYETTLSLREPEGLYETTLWLPGMPDASSEPTDNGLDSSQRPKREEEEEEEVKGREDHGRGPSSGYTAAEDEEDGSTFAIPPLTEPPQPFQDLKDYSHKDPTEPRPDLRFEAKAGALPPQDAGSHDVWDLVADGVYESIDSLGLEPDIQEMVSAPAEPRGETPITDTMPAVPEKDTNTEVAMESVPPPAAADESTEDDTAVYVNLPPFRQRPTDLPFDSSEPSGASPPHQASSPPSSSSLTPSPDDLKRDLHAAAAVPAPLPAAPDSEGWEVHVDEGSGQEFYYHPDSGETTWDRPATMMMDAVAEDLPGAARQRLSRPTSTSTPPSPSVHSSPPAGPAPGPPLAVASSGPPGWRASDWERIVDEASGRPYYYNHASGETSWDPPNGTHTHTSPKAQPRDDGPPPLPEEDYPADDEYTACLDEDDPASGTRPPGMPAPVLSPSEYSLAHVKRAVIPRACLDRSTPAGWNLHIDPDGAWVFTSEHTHEQWIKSLDDRGQTYYYLRDGSRSQWNLPEKFQPSHRRNFSDYGSDMSSSPEMHSQVMPENPYAQSQAQQHLPSLEKAGILNKTKVSENGKKVRKNWAQSWTVLHGGVLTFHKDPKSAPGSTSTKSNQILTEVTVDLRGASIASAGKEKSSKKNVLELKSQNGSEYLIQYDTESIINDWHKVIYDTIRQLEQEQHHSEEEDDVYEKVPGVDDRPLSGQEKKRVVSKQNFTSSASSASSTMEADQKKVRTKLRKFLLKRPTLQSVKEKGYIRENVFGCHLANLCAQERTTVPSFVEKCIRTVEERGLGMDGIYRVSGNLATIQKLRYKADHEDIDFEECHWDIHVITGALKLFFRELQEPLFPYSHFNNFIAGIKIQDYHEKVSYMCELVRSLPAANHDTMEILFRHLRKVIEHGEENRMSVQNVAIVFGPTLLKPEMESANITMFMVFQNQIVEFVLNEFETLFYSG